MLNLDANMIVIIITTLCTLLLSALMAAAETALTATSRARLISMIAQNHRGALRVWKILENPERFISVTLLMNNMINIIGPTIVTLYSVKSFGEASAFYATGIIATLVIIFGEILPKSFAIAKPNEIALFVTPVVSWIVFLSTPIIILIQFIINGIFKMIGFQYKGIIDEDALRQELRGSIDMSHQSGAVYKDEKDRLGGLLDLRDLDVSDVMMHRKDITMMDVEMPLQELIAEILKTPYTRVPLYQDNTENIVGVLHAKDVLRTLVETKVETKLNFEDIDIQEIMRKPWFIPETTPVTVQLNKFLSHRNHFAIVVDEYGGLRGLITLEDILEEIVGDIRDEHDVEIPGLRSQPDGSYVVNGKISIRDLNRKTGWKLPDDDYTTIAGLIIHEAKTIPDKGQSFLFFGIRFEILDRERNQITKIRTSIVPKEIAR